MVQDTAHHQTLSHVLPKKNKAAKDFVSMAMDDNGDDEDEDEEF